MPYPNNNSAGASAMDGDLLGEKSAFFGGALNNGGFFSSHVLGANEIPRTSINTQKSAVVMFFLLCLGFMWIKFRVI